MNAELYGSSENRLLFYQWGNGGLEVGETSLGQSAEKSDSLLGFWPFILSGLSLSLSLQL
jgi:hypothetical protein